MPTMIESPLKRLTSEQIEELGRELDAIHDEVYEDLGDRDRRYIVSMIELHRRLAVLGRVLLLGSRFAPAWAAGTGALSAAKILENMEIGHNVLHGQWDWMNDPYIHSSTWDWDTASTAEASSCGFASAWGGSTRVSVVPNRVGSATASTFGSSAEFASTDEGADCFDVLK